MVPVISIMRKRVQPCDVDPILFEVLHKDIILVMVEAVHALLDFAVFEWPGLHTLLYVYSKTYPKHYDCSVFRCRTMCFNSILPKHNFVLKSR